MKHRIQHQRYDILITKIVKVCRKLCDMSDGIIKTDCHGLFDFIPFIFKSPFLLDWENEVLSRRQKAGRGNLADDSATNAAIEAASIKKLTFKADSLQRVMLTIIPYSVFVVSLKCEPVLRCGLDITYTVC